MATNERIHVKTPSDLKHELNIALAEDRYKITELVLVLVQMYLDARGKKGELTRHIGREIHLKRRG